MLAERQKHGFIYENYIAKKHSLIITEDYSANWDSYEMVDNKKIPVSIKCLQKNSGIELGDFIRQTKISEDFIMYIGFWDGKTDNIVESYRLLIYYKNWVKYFGNISIIDSMFNEMKLITNDYSDDNKWYDFRKKYTNLYGNSIINLRFKRDHKKQKRIQCGISSKKFYNVVLKDNKIL